MGSRRRASSPHPRGKPLPAGDTDTAARKVAELLAHAEALLICTGAGMGVDCGFNTFRGRNAGVWGPLRALRLDYQQIVDPDWFESDPQLAWAFWGTCYKMYNTTAPHAGYQLIATWGQNLPHGLFSVTSNVDGHWGRTVDPEHVFEVHGAVTHLQSVDGSSPIWRADGAEMNALAIPTWDLVPGEAVETRVAHGSEWGPWGLASVGDDCFSIFDADGQGLAAHGVRRPGGPDLLRVPEGFPLPKCKESCVLARPNVLMFGDPNLNTTRIDERQQAFLDWQSSLPADCRLVVMEVGAGNAIPTIRSTAEEVLGKFPAANLVRINLDDSEIGQNFEGRAISIGGLGALEALTLVDRSLCELRAECKHRGF